MRRRLLASGLAALVASSALLVIDLMPAHAEPTKAGVSPTRAAWYATSPVCVVPVGCGSDAETTSYPDDTLHVGVLGAQESARAYVGFSQTALSPDVTVTSGQLVIPVDAEAGTAAPDVAALQVCVVPAGLAEPAPAEPPAADCTLSSPATYLAGTPATFVADLGVFLARSGGRLNGMALAVVPVSSSAPSPELANAWHVAFSGPGRKGGSPVLAQLELVPAVSAPSAPPVVAQPPAVPGPAVVGLPPVQPPAAVPPPAAQPPVAVAPPPGQSGFVPTSFTVPGHRFGVLWAFPLGLFLLGWAFVSTSRRDLRSYATRPVPRG